jgi:hypothetical protein
MTSHSLRALVALASLGTGLGCFLSLASLAKADGHRILVFPGNDAAAVQRDSGPVSSIPPDPPPMKARMQWVFDLKWMKGDPYLLGTHVLDVGVEQETPRAMGRFALELFEGPTLIERVRFDFPGLGAPDVRDGGIAPTAFVANLTTRIGVLFPATKKGTRLELWDRATNRRWPLPWPPEESEGGLTGR